MIKILTLCGSPVEGSSTELLLRRIANSVIDSAKTRCRHTFVRLNELDITPCQACGEDPTPAGCFIDDDMTPLYRHLMTCDCLLFGTPIYFDSMSAQSKLLVDRCNCLRPANFAEPKKGSGFIKRVHSRRPGAMVLVGGEDGWFEGARRPLAGFFKWISVENEATLIFKSCDFNRVGEVADHPKALAEADAIGRSLVRKIKR